MVFDIIVFAVIAYFYKYRDESPQTPAAPDGSDGLKRNGSDGASYPNDTIPIEEMRLKWFHSPYEIMSRYNSGFITLDNTTKYST